MSKNNKSKNTTNSECLQKDTNSSRDVTDIIGEYGPWQRFIFILTCLRGVPTAFFNISTPFFAPENKFVTWCAPPLNVPNITSKEWRDFLNTSAAELARRGFDSRCEMFDVMWAEDRHILINKNRTVLCTHWEYDRSFYESTIIEDFDMMCKNEWMISFTQSLYMGGMMIGVLLFGHLADRFGRKRVINFSVILMMSSGAAVAFSPNFVLFSIFRFTLAIGVAGAQATTFSLLMEILGPLYRTRVTFAFSFGWLFGCFLLPCLAYLVTNWKNLQLVFMSITSVLLLYLCFMPESPRWLITQRKYDEAQEIMLKAMKKNHRVVPNFNEIFINLKDRIEMEKDKKHPTVIDLFRTSILRRYTIYIYLIYFSAAFVFYGLILAQPNLGLDPFLSFFIGTAFELIAYIICIPFTRYLYRRTSMLIFTLTSAFTCFLIIPTSQEYFWLRFTGAMISKLCISGALTMIPIHAAEIFPTVIRTVGSGSSLMIGRIGGMSVPFIKELGNFTDPSVPPIVFGLLCFLASFMVYLLPETFNQVLPDTMLDVENIKQSLELKKVKEKLLLADEKNKRDKNSLIEEEV